MNLDVKLEPKSYDHIWTGYFDDEKPMISIDTMPDEGIRNRFRSFVLTVDGRDFGLNIEKGERLIFFRRNWFDITSTGVRIPRSDHHGYYLGKRDKPGRFKHFIRKLLKRPIYKKIVIEICPDGGVFIDTKDGREYIEAHPEVIISEVDRNGRQKVILSRR